MTASKLKVLPSTNSGQASVVNRLSFLAGFAEESGAGGVDGAGDRVSATRAGFAFPAVDALGSCYSAGGSVGFVGFLGSCSALDVTLTPKVSISTSTISSSTIAYEINTETIRNISQLYDAPEVCIFNLLQLST